VVGTPLWSASAGIPVPRTHAGPVLEGPGSSVKGALYHVLGGDFYVQDTVTSAGKTTSTTAVFGTFLCRGCSATGMLTYIGYPPGFDDSESSAMIGVHRIDVGESVMLLPSATITTEYRAPPSSKSVPQMIRVTLPTTNGVPGVWMLGLIEENVDAGFENTIYPSEAGNESASGNVGGGRGLRGVFRDGVQNLRATLERQTAGVSYSTAHPELTLARWRYVRPLLPNNTAGVPVTVSRYLPTIVEANARRVCVPLTIRVGVDETTFANRASNEEIYRRDPVDCVVAGSVTHDADVNMGLFGPGGMCSGSQQLNWPTGRKITDTSIVNIDDDAGYVTNLRYFSRWFWAMYGTSPMDAPHFFDQNRPATTAIPGGPDIAVVLSGSRLPGGRARGEVLKGVPNCSPVGGTVAQCNIAFDLTG
jgi:hypothetical protein